MTPLKRVHLSAVLTAALLSALLAAGCRDVFVTGSSGALEFQPALADFGSVYVGAEAATSVTLTNSGRSSLPVKWDAPDGPFELFDAPSLVPAGALTVSIRFKPTDVGDQAADLLGHSEGATVKLSLQGSAIDVPGCPTPANCHAMRFDLDLGACVETELADATPCDAHSACLVSTTCQNGVCTGPGVDCDDGDACTVDLCDALKGCEHLAAPPCPGDGICQAGVCRPTTGCGLQQAADGTSCGPQHGCDVADVCIAGACVQRDPPDGFICAPTSPCQAEGRCQGSDCVQAPPVPLQPTWGFDAKGLPDGGSQTLHDLVLEPDGAVSMMGFFATPALRANTAGAMALESTARRCILWNARLVCADYPSSPGGTVSAVDPATGTSKWTFDLPAARPDWVTLAAPGRIFMARLAVLGSDRLAALFEAYPAGQPGDTLCRLYFLVLLDSAGTMVSATRVLDPMLDVCNHPHPYGVAADVAGDLYLSFSPSSPGVAPLVPQPSTLLVSYSRDGVARWKRQEAFVGGELAVALGALYPENSGGAYGTATGDVALVYGQLPTGTFGRPLITTDLVVAVPFDSKSLTALDRTSGAPAWTFNENLAPGLARLASWRARPAEPPRTVALAFVLGGELPWLTAVETRFGTEAWRCPVGGDLRSSPELFEVVNGTMALMEGTGQCSRCDPPFALGSGAFHTYALPGIETPSAPWTGTWGGPGHDHREDLLGVVQPSVSQ